MANVLRALVDRDARRATRLVKGGERCLRRLKEWVHQADRSATRRALHALERGADAEAADFQPRRRVTGWDVA